MPIFMKFDGIDGESSDEGHQGWIDIDAMSWGVSQPSTVGASAGGRGAERPVVSDIAVTKSLDKSTPKLLLKCCQGEHLSKGIIDFTQQSAEGPPQPYFKVEMEDIIVSGIAQGGSGGEDRLTENVTLNFAKFMIEYTEQKRDGSMERHTMGWDIIKAAEF